MQIRRVRITFEVVIFSQFPVSYLRKISIQYQAKLILHFFTEQYKKNGKFYSNLTETPLVTKLLSRAICKSFTVLTEGLSADLISDLEHAVSIYAF